jgi:hypothetical protein
MLRNAYRALPLALTVLACKDDTIQDVPTDICVSGTRWIGGKRGDPRMYPGRDCVGCHLENDGPELMLGGTIYSYVESDFARAMLPPPSGHDCFGEPNQTVEITGGDGQLFVVTTNEAGNFFVEGKATDLVKPFTVVFNWLQQDGTPKQSPMGTTPSYGGCGRCHSRDAQAVPGPGETKDDYTDDETVVPVGSGIGMPGNLNLMKAP